MLIRLVEDEVRVLVDQLLHGILHELVKRVKLLSYETFLVEETGYYGPAVLLGYLLKIVVQSYFIIGIIVQIVVLSGIEFSRESFNHGIDIRRIRDTFLTHGLQRGS